MDHTSFDDTMTAEQFIQYCVEEYVYLEEQYQETLAQFRSECAMFGDAGPGQALRVGELNARLHGMRTRYHQLTGSSLTSDAYPYGWENYHTEYTYNVCTPHGDD